MIWLALRHCHLRRQLGRQFRRRWTVVGSLRRAAISLGSPALVAAIARAWGVRFRGMYLSPRVGLGRRLSGWGPRVVLALGCWGS